MSIPYTLLNPLSTSHQFQTRHTIPFVLRQDLYLLVRLLSFPTPLPTRAYILLQRFALSHEPEWSHAAACVLLVHPRSDTVRDTLLRAATHIRSLNEPDLAAAEQQVLAALGFDTRASAPEELVLIYSKVLQLPVETVKDAVIIAADSIAASDCLGVVCQTQEIACAALSLASLRRGDGGLEKEPLWWQLFDVSDEQYGHALAMVCGSLESSKEAVNS